jgi:hypothetical protein
MATTGTVTPAPKKGIVGRIVDKIKKVVAPPKTPSSSNPVATPNQYSAPIGPSSPPKDGVSKTPTGGQSIADKPFYDTQKKTTSSGSSGGRSSPAPSSTQVQPQSTLSTPTPAATVSTYNADKDIFQPKAVQPSFVQTAIQRQQMSRYEAPQPTLKDKVVGAYNKVTGKAERDKAITQEQMALSQGTRTSTPLYGGTQSTTYQPYTSNEIIKMAKEGKISESSAMGALQNLEEKKYGTQYSFAVNTKARELENKAREELQQQVNVGTQIVENEKARLQERVNSGNLTPEKANEILADRVKKVNASLEKATQDINIRNQNELNSSSEQWVSTRGAALQKDSYKYLDKVSDKIKLEKTKFLLPAYVVAGAGLGVGLSAVAATGAVASGIIQTAGIAGGGIAAVQTGKAVGTSYAQGTLTATKLSNIFLPIAAFSIGAVAGTRLATGAKVDSVKLKGAIERADIKTTVTKSITSESQIARLNIPEGQKAELISGLRSGQTLRQVSVEVVPKNAGDTSLINKGIPNRKISFVEYVNTEGKVINRVALGKVEIRKGVYSFKEDIYSRGTGIAQGENAVIDSITLTGKSGKPIQSAVKTRDIIQTKVSVKGNQRGVVSRSTSYKAGEVTASKGKPITIEDLQKVSKSQINKIQSKTKFGEVQEQKQLNAILQELPNQERIIGTERVYKTKAGVGITENVPEPFTFDKAMGKAISKGSKVYGRDTSLNIDVGGKGQIQSQVQKFDVKNLPTSDLSSSIKNVLKSSASQFSSRQSPFYGTGTYELTEQATDFKLPSLRITGRVVQEIKYPKLESKVRTSMPQVPSNKIISDLIRKEEEKIKIFTIPTTRKDVRPKQLDRQLQVPKQSITPRQLQKQINKVVQMPRITTRPYIPTLPVIPNFNPPQIPKWGKERGQGYKPIKISKRKGASSGSAYSSSLLAAFFQSKPVKVSKKQYEALGKKTYTGAEFRPVLQIVDDKEFNNQIKKALSI